MIPLYRTLCIKGIQKMKGYRIPSTPYVVYDIGSPSKYTYKVKLIKDEEYAFAPTVFEYITVHRTSITYGNVITYNVEWEGKGSWVFSTTMLSSIVRFLDSLRDMHNAFVVSKS